MSQASSTTYVTGDRAAGGTIVTFDLAGQFFGVEVNHVREILDRQPLAQVPNAGASCVGLIDTRGQSIPVIDLACRFGLVRADGAEPGRIVVFERADRSGVPPLGVLADRVLDVMEIDETGLEDPPRKAFLPEAQDTVRGLTRLDGRLVYLLDIGALLSSEPGPGPRHGRCTA